MKILNQPWQPYSTFNLPESRPNWWASHAQLPTPILFDDKIRVYVMARDESNQSRVGWVDLSRDDPRNVLAISDTPALSLGEIGCFDDMGVAPSCVVREQDSMYLYYVGITARKSVSLDYLIGLAISRDNGNSFERIYTGPIIGKSADEPFLCTSPYVTKKKERWSMIYTSGLGWININENYEMIYDIKIRESINGIQWGPSISLLGQIHDMEAIGRPWLDNNNILYFCSRDSLDFRDGAGSYKILTASKHRNEWQRIPDKSSDTFSLNNSNFSIMNAYPAILTVGNVEYLFYNGAGFGRTGIEIAIRSYYNLS